MVLHAIGLEGIDGYRIDVSVKVLGGMATMNIIGLGDQAIREAKDRIESVFSHYQFKYPKGKIVISLVPCDTKKSGSYLDLVMLLGLLIATQQINPMDFDANKTLFLAAVGLNGELLGVRGILSMVINAKKMGFSRVVISSDNFYEASACAGIELIAYDRVLDVLKWLERRVKYVQPQGLENKDFNKNSLLDYAQVKGQGHILTYVVAAAAGAHNLLLIGPPGCGKSMIAKRLPSILPQLNESEALEALAIHSLVGSDLQSILAGSRPFRAPHYNASQNAIIGGGTNATPGEISLAHHGVLFLDELPEYPVAVLEALRQPLEDRVVTVARVKHTNTFPASFMLVGAMNPCKCGYYGYPQCSCSPNEVLRYKRRISGPVYDRIDIQKFMGPAPIGQDTVSPTMTSTEMRTIVLEARAIQKDRFKGQDFVFANAHMNPQQVEAYCKLNGEATEYLDIMLSSLKLSRRSYDKVLVVARTFADIKGSVLIEKEHILHALMARDLDREQRP